MKKGKYPNADLYHVLLTFLETTVSYLCWGLYWETAAANVVS